MTTDTNTTTTITVSGMTCRGCARRVRAAIAEVPGVLDAEVDLASGSVTITGDDELPHGPIRAAVETAGYEVAS